MFRDVSEQHHAKLELERQRRLLLTLADNTDAALFVMDDQQRCTFMNAAAQTRALRATTATAVATENSATNAISGDMKSGIVAGAHA